MQPRVGRVFSPNEPLVNLFFLSEVWVQRIEINCLCLFLKQIPEDPLSPRLEIQAYAGPMSKNDAEVFQKKWRTPSRSGKSRRSPLALRLCDAEKGLERIGR